MIAPRVAFRRCRGAYAHRTKPVVTGITSAGGQAIALAADAADPGAVRDSVTGTTASFGRLDILVNNAGIGIVGPLGELMPSLTPAGRFAKPDELTGLIAYLAGPESGFLTGATINIDGGFTT